MESLYSIWKNKTDIGKTKWTVSGDSIAGVRTSFYLQELKVQLDAGYQNFNKTKDIFITHTHADHIASLPLIILENISNKIITNVYCPKQSTRLLINMINSFLMCNYNNSNPPKNTYNVIGLEPEYKTELYLNNQDITIESFYSVHTVPTLSYGFIHKIKKLKEEFINKTTQEIISLKNEGVDITEVINYKKLIFCGDTSIYIFKLNPGILEYNNIIIECTFFDDAELDLAISRRHMHWIQLKDVIISNPTINFYLIHISARYKDKKEIVDNYIMDLSNVFLL
jgi:ribonuclease BN (tRNA processing enzyme)